jgi:hypothetical protein
MKTLIKRNSSFYKEIFSNHRHSYQIDFLINTPANYLPLININTRYSIFESISDLQTTYILRPLKYTFKKLKLKSLESDEEAAFVSNPVLNPLRKRGYNIVSLLNKDAKTSILSTDSLENSVNVRKINQCWTLILTSSTIPTTEQCIKPKEDRQVKLWSIKNLKYSPLFIP